MATGATRRVGLRGRGCRQRISQQGQGGRRRGQGAATVDAGQGAATVDAGKARRRVPAWRGRSRGTTRQRQQQRQVRASQPAPVQFGRAGSWRHVRAAGMGLGLGAWGLLPGPGPLQRGVALCVNTHTGDCGGARQRPRRHRALTSGRCIPSCARRAHARLHAGCVASGSRALASELPRMLGDAARLSKQVPSRRCCRPVFLAHNTPPP